MKLRELKQIWIEKLAHIYDAREVGFILRQIWEERTGKSGMAWISHQEEGLDINLEEELSSLQSGLPIQHILGFTEFMDLRFKVNSDVLVPRPETEDLVRFLIDELPQNASVLDVGTGSSCIAISLKINRPDLQVSALDVSEKALQVARENAASLNANIEFIHEDALGNLEIGEFDVVVSNPPYIEEFERSRMSDNVLKHDPDTALFVPDGQALLFYERISDWANKFEKRPFLAFECHIDHVDKVAHLVRLRGWEKVDNLKDITERERFVIARS